MSPVLRKLDSDTRLAEHDFIVRLEPYATGTAKDRNGLAAPDDPGSVFAPVIVQSEAAGRRLVGDVRVRPRNRLVDPAVRTAAATHIYAASRINQLRKSSSAASHFTSDTVSTVHNAATFTLELPKAEPEPRAHLVSDRAAGAGSALERSALVISILTPKGNIGDR